MKKNIFKIASLCFLMFCVASLGVVAYGEDVTEKTPEGWSKGLKKGWQGNMPPGLSKKESKKISKEAEKAAKEVDKQKEKAEKEAKKAQKQAEKDAKKQKKKAEKEAKRAEKEARKAQQQAEKEAGKVS